MAKDNSQGAGTQYKVLLKPTDVGLLVMRRMERPHLDKSAELRRLIELGYAAEQAGFILDGTVLRHGGRVWDVQPTLSPDAQPRASAVTRERSQVDAAGQRAGTQADSSPVAEASPAPMPVAPAPAAEAGKKDQAAKGSPMRANLRNLSS